MVAKSLRNRVRGWFPQEPYIISRQIRQVKVDHETKQPPLMIPPQYKVSATKTAGIMLIYWIILYGFISYININLERYPVSSISNCGMDSFWCNSWRNFGYVRNQKSA